MLQVLLLMQQVTVLPWLELMLKLGGSLTESTTIAQGNNPITFSGNNGVSISTTNNSVSPLYITQPLNGSLLTPGLMMAGESGTPAIGQAAFIGLNPNKTQGAWPIAIGAQYISGSSNQGFADFFIATSNGGTAEKKFVVKNYGNVGIGTVNPSTKLEVVSGASGTSGLKLTNLPNVSSLATDSNGNIIAAGNSITSGVNVDKQRMTIASPSVILNSTDGSYSFRYSTTVAGGFWEIRNNTASARAVSTFVTESWVGTGYSVQSAMNSLHVASFTTIPGSSAVNSDNELNVYRIYDIASGIIYKFEGILISSGGLKEVMILEQF